MEIIRAQARPTRQARADRFTGQVFQDEVVVGTPPSRMRATNVSFSPGARTAWHSHPVGQVLYVLSGVGRVPLEGEAVQELRPGDTALIPPAYGRRRLSLLLVLLLPAEKQGDLVYRFGGQTDGNEKQSHEDKGQTFVYTVHQVTRI